MYKQIKSFLEAPFLVWEYTAKRKWILFFCAMCFIILFKLAYKPFGLDSGHRFVSSFRHNALTGAIILFQLFISPKLFGGYFQEIRRSRGREILWLALLFFNLIILHGILSQIEKPNESFWVVLKFSLSINLGIGIFPVTIILILAYIRQLREETKHKHKSPLPQKKETPVEKFEGVSLPNLLFIKSLDNYSEFHYLNNGQVEKKVIRKSLLSVEDYLSKKGFIRVHRSYIVNKTHIDSMIGNANKSFLQLKKQERLIPVSRSKRTEVQNHIDTIH